MRKIIHIDIDRDELNKNKTVTLPICADIKAALLQGADLKGVPNDQVQETVVRLIASVVDAWVASSVRSMLTRPPAAASRILPRYRLRSGSHFMFTGLV